MRGFVCLVVLLTACGDVSDATSGEGTALGQSGVNALACATLDFERDADAGPILPGSIVDEQSSLHGVHVSCANNRAGHPDACLAFNSAAPTGGDEDLGTPHEDFGGPGVGAGGEDGSVGENAEPLSNVLIIAENLDDSDGDGLVDDPDDEARGGQIELLFDVPVNLISLTALDIDSDEQGGSAVVCGDVEGDELIVPLETLGNNSVQHLPIGVEKTVRVTIDLVSSGALAELEVCFDDQPDEDDDNDDSDDDEPGA